MEMDAPTPFDMLGLPLAERLRHQVYLPLGLICHLPRAARARRCWHIEYQKAVEWLEQYREGLLELERLGEEQERLESLAEKVTPSPSQAPGGGGGSDRVGDAVIKIDEARRRLSEAVAEFLELEEKIKAAIKAVKPLTERLLLEYRYIDGLAWYEIQGKLHYSETHVKRLHRQALEKIKMA